MIFEVLGMKIMKMTFHKTFLHICTCSSELVDFSFKGSKRDHVQFNIRHHQHNFISAGSFPILMTMGGCSKLCRLKSFYVRLPNGILSSLR